MYLHQSHTYTRTPPGCTRKRRRARGRSIYLLPYQASPHPSSHSIHPPGPTAAPAELQGSQAVQTRPHSSQIGSDLPPAAATAPAAVDRLATPAHAHNNSAPCTWPTWPCPSPNPSAGWTFGPAAALEALAHTSPASPTTLTHRQMPSSGAHIPPFRPEHVTTCNERAHPMSCTHPPGPRGLRGASWRCRAVLQSTIVPRSPHSAPSAEAPIWPQIQLCATRTFVPTPWVTAI